MQDTVELQETLLHFRMDRSLVQENKKMMQIILDIVPRPSKVPGGIKIATIQTSMVSTMVVPMLMVWTGTHGRDIFTPSNSLKWKWGNKKWIKKWLLTDLVVVVYSWVDYNVFPRFELLDCSIVRFKSNPISSKFFCGISFQQPY